MHEEYYFSGLTEVRIQTYMEDICNNHMHKIIRKNMTIHAHIHRPWLVASFLDR
jgi:hypothetical protein